MKNKKINNIRKKLDSLDNKLLALFKKRTLLVNKILETKEFKNQIIDKKRINIILNSDMLIEKFCNLYSGISLYKLK